MEKERHSHSLSHYFQASGWWYAQKTLTKYLHMYVQKLRVNINYKKEVSTNIDWPIKNLVSMLYSIVQTHTYHIALEEMTSIHIALYIMCLTTFDLIADLSIYRPKIFSNKLCSLPIYWKVSFIRGNYTFTPSIR